MYFRGMILSITWNPSPELFDLGFIAPRWYGLFFALGFIAAYAIVKKIFLAEKKSLEDLDSLTTHVILGTILGARLGHCLFYQPEYYLSNPIEIFKIWEGGLASHGAAIGILISIAIFSYKNKGYSFLWLTDTIVLTVPLAGAFVRLGNLMNSEIVGKPTDLPWGFIFPRLQFDSQFGLEKAMIPRHPAQLYEAIGYFIIYFFLRKYHKQNAQKGAGKTFGMFLILLFGLRFMIEFLKEHQVSFESNLPLDMGQLLSLPLIAIGFYFAFRNQKATL